MGKIGRVTTYLLTVWTIQATLFMGVNLTLRESNPWVLGAEWLVLVIVILISIRHAREVICDE